MSQVKEAPWVERALPAPHRVETPISALTPRRLDLTRQPGLRRILVNRWPQFIARAVTLAGFVFVILAGLFGSPVGSHNFAIIIVWIAWWTALKLVFIPFGGRSWCSVCPIPLPGEWLQQGSFLERSSRRLGWSRRWPRKLRGTWLQSSSFLLIGLFSAVTLTDPRLTAWVLLGLILLAVGLSLVFENRAFCSYLCPIGGFTGIYAKAAPVELRVNDPAVCAAHAEKTCYQQCPWGVYPLALKDNAACGLCMECLRVCPQDNLAVNLRPFGSDLTAPPSTSRLDETFLALVMLGSGLAFSAVFTGPWGALKLAAFQIGSAAWGAYAAGFLALNLGLIPGLYTLVVWAGQRWSGSRLPLRRSLAENAQVLLPLGLCAWIAFTISFALPKASYVLAVLSDPLGWGWNLFGTARLVGSPDFTGWSSVLQAVILVVGLFWSAQAAQSLDGRRDSQTLRHRLPVLIFCLVYSLVMLFLLIG